MRSSTKMLLGLAAAAGGIAGVCFWWWTRLMTNDFAACVATAAPIGVDCRHDSPFYGALIFAVLAVALLLATATRGAMALMASRRAA